MLYFRGELRNKIFAHFQGTFTLQWPPLTSWSSCSAYWGLYQLAIQCQRFTHIHLPVLGHWLPSPQNLPAHDSIFRSCARQDVGWHDMDTDGDIGIQSVYPTSTTHCWFQPDAPSTSPWAWCSVTGSTDWKLLESAYLCFPDCLRSGWWQTSSQLRK